MCGSSVGMHLPSTLLSLENCLTCLHTLCTPTRTGWQVLAICKCTGGKREKLCSSFNCSLNWDEFAMKSLQTDHG